MCISYFFEPFASPAFEKRRFVPAIQSIAVEAVKLCHVLIVQEKGLPQIGKFSSPWVFFTRVVVSNGNMIFSL